MSDQKDYVRKLDELFSRIFEELRATSDAEILGDESAEAVRARSLARLERARTAAGKNRLAAARAALNVTPITKARPAVSIETARAHVQKALNDSRYTLAARQLAEMSDADIFAIYTQLLELEEKKES